MLQANPVKRKVSIGVNRNLCIGCGICVRVCPTGAISIVFNKALINKQMCNNCYQCVYTCPKSAIGIEWKRVINLNELKTNISNMQKKADNIIQRIAKLE